MVALQVASADMGLNNDLVKSTWRNASGDRKVGGGMAGLAAGKRTMTSGTGHVMTMTHGVNGVTMIHGVDGSASDVIMSTCLFVFQRRLFRCDRLNPCRSCY